MLWHVLIMVNELQGVLTSFFHSEGARHVHVSGVPWTGFLRVASKHLVITIQAR